MKEIRFRAFVKNLKRMVPVEMIDFTFQTVVVDLTDGNGDVSEYGFDEIELIQFTGLKDKNGKEIYEGDICLDSKGALMVVVYENGCFYLEYQRTDIGMGYLFREIPFIRVIGNFLEHPELLTATK